MGVRGLFRPWMLIPLLTGLPFLAIGLTESYKAYRIVTTFVPAEGTVVDNDMAFSGDGVAYVPIVKFLTHDEELVRFTDSAGTYPAQYDVGDRVDVFYNPEDVHDARIRTFGRLWFGPLWVTGIGLLPSILALGVLWGMRRRGGLV